MSALTLGIGLHAGVTAALYHSDPCEAPSLSSGVARTLIEKSPAHAYLEHIRLGGHKIEPTSEMIFGSYVHGLLADDISDFEVGVFDDYRTKDARAWREAVEELGKTPILEHIADRAGRVAKALRDKAAVGVTNSPFERGTSEVTAIWQEDSFWFRARYDRLILDEAGYADIWDWKTTGTGVSDKAILRRIIDGGYHIQAAHYMRGLRALAPRFAGRMSFIFAFVETEPPFAVRRVVLSDGFLSLASGVLSRAIDTWKHCLATDTWPDGSGDTLTLEPPAWMDVEVEALTGMTEVAA